MATSPRKSPTPRKSIASGSNKPRKTAKTSMKGKSNDETADDSTQEMKKQTKSKKSTGRKSVKVAGSSKKETQGVALTTDFRSFLHAYHLMVSQSEREESFEKVHERDQGEHRRRWARYHVLWLNTTFDHLK